tara:strand:- start:15642 stop:16247 length:606 start_codon:yes stop_codon:yes gene_type:complete
MKIVRWVFLAALIAVCAVLLARYTQAPVDRAVVEERTIGSRIWYPKGHYPSLTLAGTERRVVRSLLAQRHAMYFGDFIWEDVAKAGEPVWIRVDLGRQLMSVFRGADEIGSAVILYGTDGKPTPTGLFTVLETAKEHRSSLYDAEMPFMLRLTNDGIAIHASEVVEGSATHGCIGLPAEFAERLFNVIKRGDVVAILRSSQ